LNSAGPVTVIAAYGTSSDKDMARRKLAELERAA
jgi:hypothetical protein